MKRVSESDQKKRRPLGYWEKEEGLKRAEEWIQVYHDREGEPPTRRNLPSGIMGAIQRGEYENQDIKSFNDLLEYCGLEIHQRQSYWTGEWGLERTKEWALDFHEKEGKPPTLRDIPGGVKGAIYRGEYEDQGIESFNDLLEYCGLETHQQKPGYWTGEEGFERVKEWCLNFHEERGRSPTREDVPSGIRDAIQRGEYEKYGVSAPFDLSVEVLPEHLPEVFEAERVKEYHHNWKKLLGKMLDRELVHEIDDGYYTPDQELAEILSSSEKKEGAEKGEGTFSPPSKIKIFTKEAESEIELIERWEV